MATDNLTEIERARKSKHDGGGDMDQSEFERKADQLARQLEDVRDRVNEFTKDYRTMVEVGQGQIQATAQQTRAAVAETLSGLRENPRPWRIPVGVVALIVVIAILAKNVWSHRAK